MLVFVDTSGHEKLLYEFVYIDLIYGKYGTNKKVRLTFSDLLVSNTSLILLSLISWALGEEGATSGDIFGVGAGLMELGEIAALGGSAPSPHFFWNTKSGALL